MQFVTSDLIQLLIGIVIFVTALGAAIFAGRALGIFPREWLNLHEWAFVLKILGIIIFALALHLTSIATHFPADEFIYGRF
jgi:hypothetical protein